MIADSVAFLVAAGQARRLRRRALLRRLARRPRLRAGLPARRGRGGRRARRAVRHQRLVAAAPGRRGDAPRSRGAVGDGRASASTATTTPSCGVANTLAAVEAGATPGAGHDERLRRAHRQREPRLDHRQPPAQDGPRRCSSRERLARLTETAHFVDELLNLAPDPRAAVRRHATPSRTRAACTSPACAPTPRPSSTSTRRWSATRASCWSPSSPGAHTVAEKAAAAGLELDDEAAARDRRARQGARARRLPVRGRRRLVRAADAPRDRRLRAALPPRVLARDRRAARRRQGRDRGDDQDLGRRRALRAHRRGQRPGQRARPRAARRDHRDPPAPRDIELVNFKVRILDETTAPARRRAC